MPATATNDVVYLHPDDNVCIAARDLDARHASQRPDRAT